MEKLDLKIVHGISIKKISKYEPSFLYYLRFVYNDYSCRFDAFSVHENKQALDAYRMGVPVMTLIWFFNRYMTGCSLQVAYYV